MVLSTCLPPPPIVASRPREASQHLQANLPRSEALLTSHSRSQVLCRTGLRGRSACKPPHGWDRKGTRLRSEGLTVSIQAQWACQLELPAGNPCFGSRRRCPAGLITVRSQLPPFLAESCE